MGHVVVDPPGFAEAPVFCKIMNISALNVVDLSKKSLLRHVQGCHLEEIVAAVLEHHAVAAGLLAGVDDLPALVDAHRSRDFDGGMFAVVHRVDSHWHMVQPVGRDVDKVQILHLAKLSVGFFPDETLSRRKTGRGQDGIADVHPGRIQIAEGNDFHIVQKGESLDSRSASSADPDKTHTDSVDRVTGHAEGRFLSRLPCRCFKDDDSVFHPGRNGSADRFLALAGRKAKQRKNRKEEVFFHT